MIENNANVPSLEALYKEAEDLWSNISTRAEHILMELIQEADHEILMDIAEGKNIQWDADLKLLAKALQLQGKAVSILDQLVLDARKASGNSRKQ